MRLLNLLSMVSFTGLALSIFAFFPTGVAQAQQFELASYVQEENEEPEEDTDADLADELRALKVRLAELEDDVAKKLETEKEAEEDSDEEDTDELDERFEEIEEALEEQGESIESIDSQIPNFVVSGHKTPKMKFFGRIHLDYWAFPRADLGIETLEGENPQDRVQFRRMRIGVSGDLNDNMFYKYEGEFAGGEATSYRDAFIGFKNSDLFNTIIVGNHKRPYGLDHINSSRYNVFIERPFIVEAFNQDSRRLGISSNGFTEDEKFNWRYGLWNQRLTQTSAGYVGDHYQPEVAARIGYVPWMDKASGGRGYAHFGLSGMYGVPDGRTTTADNDARYRTRPEARSSSRWLDTGRISGADQNMLFGLESVFNVGAFQFTGEYMRANVDRLDAVGEDVAFEGGYLQVAYFLTGEHTPWNAQTGQLGRVKPFENFFSVRDCDCNVQRGLGAWQIAARYSWADLTDKDIIGGEGESLTLGLNWWWNPHARMQFNYIAGEIERDPIASGNYNIVGVRFMVDF